MMLKIVDVIYRRILNVKTVNDRIGHHHWNVCKLIVDYVSLINYSIRANGINQRKHNYQKYKFE